MLPLAYTLVGFLIKLPSILTPIKVELSLLLRGKRTINPDVFVNPQKYAVCIPLDKIVADTKVERQGIDSYKEKIKRHEKIAPLIVVKHPRKDIYAVLDGHHRYYAYAEMGKKEIDCAISGDFSSVIFYLTEHGYLQPSVEITKQLRRPAKTFHKNLIQFLSDFLKNPKVKKTLQSAKESATTVKTIRKKRTPIAHPTTSKAS